MPDGTPSVKRTLTTEFLVEVEDERAEMLYMCQETARKILNPIESDEMNMKRIVCCMKRVPIARCQIEIDTFPESANVLMDSDWAGQPQTCRSRSEGIVQWGNVTLSAWSRTQQSVRLTRHFLTTGVAEMATKCLSRASLDTR